MTNNAKAKDSFIPDETETEEYLPSTGGGESSFIAEPEQEEDQLPPIDKKEFLKKFIQSQSTTPAGNVLDFLGGGLQGLQGFLNLITGDKVTKFDLTRKPEPSSLQEKLLGQPSTMAKPLGEMAPFAAAGGTSLPGMMAGGALYGASMTKPEEENLFGYLPKGKVGGAIENALIPGIFNVAGKVAKPLYKVSSEAITKNINEMLGGKKYIGQKVVPKTVSEHAREFAGKVREYYKKARAEGQKMFEDVFDTKMASGTNAGDVKVNPKGKLYSDKSMVRDYTPDIKDMYNVFEKDPTSKNLHFFQSQVGDEIRSLEDALKKGTLDQNGKRILQNLRKVRSEAISDIEKALPTNIVDNYKKARSNWHSNVSVLHAPNKLSTIAQTEPGKLKGNQIVNIHELFKNPNSEMLDLLEKIDPDYKTTILKLAVGNKEVPEELLKQLSQRYQLGFKDYFTPTLKQQMEELPKSIKRKETLKLLGKYVGKPAALGAAAATGAAGAYEGYRKLIKGK